MAENEIEGNALGVSWDGTGYGLDGSIWGGEFLLVNNNSFKRIGHLRNFRLPGGEKAIKEIWRSELGILYEIFKDKAFEIFDLRFKNYYSNSQLNNLKVILSKKINTPETSSAGRLFDAVASMVGITDYASYEGKAAMMLEFAIKDTKAKDSYPFEIIKIKSKNPANDGKESENKYVIDWEPMVKEILKEKNKKKVSVELISVKFHNTLAEMILAMAKKIGEQRIVLSGGCFQNKYLIEKTINLLQKKGFRVYWHQRVPTNDGGISLGQIKYAVDLNKSF